MSLPPREKSKRVMSRANMDLGRTLAYWGSGVKRLLAAARDEVGVSRCDQ